MAARCDVDSFANERDRAGGSPQAVVRSFLRDSGLRRPLVALSGGPDSVCLLVAAIACAAPLALDVGACYVDHALRPIDELDRERRFVGDLCARLGVPLRIERAERGSIEARAAGEGGVEAAARNFRYAALEKARVSDDRDAILTGHNQDDFIETMAMRLFTGAGTAGLRGIPERNGWVMRPMLSVSKARILAYLDECRQAYMVDSTNASPDYLRNRVRAELIPVLRSIFPHLDAALRSSASKAADDEEALEAAASALVVESDRGCDGDGRYAPVEGFIAAPKAVRLRALYKLAGGLANGRFPGGLAAEAASWAGHSPRLAEGAGVEFVSEGGRVIARRREAIADGDVEPESRGFGMLIGGPGTVRIGTDETIEVYSGGRDGAPIGAELSWPVWIRSRRPGDSVLAERGSYAVDELFSGWGIAIGLRPEVPIIEDVEGIVAVLGGAFGGRDIYRTLARPSGVSAGSFVFVMKGAVPRDASRRQ